VAYLNVDIAVEGIGRRLRARAIDFDFDFEIRSSFFFPRVCVVAQAIIRCGEAGLR
jgi:hypothetical protein